MDIQPFALERYFAEHEFSTPLTLSASDCEPLSMQELLSMGDEESLQWWDQLHLGYTESQGHPLLREKIASLFHGVHTDDVLTVVPEEGIYLFMQALLKTGDKVVCTYPGYQSLYQVALSKGCHVDHWSPHPTPDGWQFKLEDVEKLLTPQTKLLVLNFPHNPTGATLEPSIFRELLAKAASLGIWVFSDEMYRFLEYTLPERLPSAAEINPRFVSLGGLSKSFGVPGLRSGWLLCREKNLMELLKTWKDYTSICGSAPSEVLSSIALGARETIWNRIQNRMSANLQGVDSFFKKYAEHFDWLPPQAGPVALVGWKGKGKASDFCTALRSVQGVLLLPSAVYGMDDKHFRVGFGRENLPEALDKLELFIKTI